MAHTDKHNPFRTTRYAQESGHNRTHWKTAAKHFRRPESDSNEIHRQTRERRRRDQVKLRNITRDPERYNDESFHSSQRRDVYAWPTY